MSDGRPTPQSSKPAPKPASKGLLLVISAPSGAGKTSLVKALLDRDASLAVSVSHTTRPARPGEVDGENYHFVDRARFEAMIAGGEFVEYADVFGNLYGTARESLAQGQSAGHDLVLEIDWQGAEQVRRSFPDAISVFVLPPSRATLLERLNNRGQDSPEVIAKRTALAHTELAQYEYFDYLLVNDDFDTAVSELHAVLTAERLKAPVARPRHADLLTDLLR